MKKHDTIVFLTALLALGLSACGGTDPAPEPLGAPPDTTITLGDGRDVSIRFGTDSSGGFALLEGEGFDSQRLGLNSDDMMGADSVDWRDYFDRFPFEQPDVNFDGVPDLTRVAWMGAYNVSKQFWILDPASGAFVYNEQLSSLINPRLEPERSLVTAYDRSGAIFYRLRDFVWDADSLRVVRIEARDLPDEATPDRASASIETYAAGRLLLRCDYVDYLGQNGDVTRRAATTNQPTCAPGD